ncbi:MAG: hypothetical protein ACREKL_03850 [Chthoniobacterales bacterium]
MRMFTFSGIEPSFFKLNDGSGLRDFANSVKTALAPAACKYDGDPKTDHFVSNVNFKTLLSNAEGVVSLSGSPVLNAESAAFAPKYGAMVLDELNAPGADADEILVLAHSQGTSNFSYTWRWLLENHRDEITSRVTRVAMFDPKVGTAYVDWLMRADNGQNFLEFLFFQSELDPLDNQTLGRETKFIDNYDIGDHLWVRGLDHGSIVSWKAMNKTPGMLTRPKYLKFRAARHRVMVHADIATSPSRRQGTNLGLALRGFVSGYSMINDSPSVPLLGFLRGRLPKKFESKADDT